MLCGGQLLFLQEGGEDEKHGKNRGAKETKGRKRERWVHPRKQGLPEPEVGSRRGGKNFGGTRTKGEYGDGSEKERKGGGLERLR